MRARKNEVLLTPREVAAEFGVGMASVARWGQERKLLPVMTPAGHRRFFAVEVDALLRGESPKAARELAEAERDRLAPKALSPAGDA